MHSSDKSLGRAAARLGRLAWRCVTVARESAAGVVPLLGREEQAQRVQGLARQLLCDHGIHIVIKGPVPDSAAVFVANHVSHMDPLVIAALKPLLPIAKGEISKWPFVGRVAHSYGVMFVKRGSTQSGARVLRSALRALQQGVSVLNFPEGTTTLGSEVLAFKRGIFGVAAIAGAPVIPTALRFEPEGMAWVGNSYFVTHCLRTFGRSRWTAYVSFGKAIYSHRQTSAAEMAIISRHEILRLLGSEPYDGRTNLTLADSPPIAAPAAVCEPTFHRLQRDERQ